MSRVIVRRLRQLEVRKISVSKVLNVYQVSVRVHSTVTKIVAYSNVIS